MPGDSPRFDLYVGRCEFYGRSRSYVFEHTAKAFGIERGWLYQREEYDFDSPPLWRAAAELHWRGVLGQRVLCFDGWFG